MVRIVWRGARASAVALLAVCGAACVSKAPRAVQTYTLDPPPVSVPPGGGVIVSLARVRVSPPYAAISFVYRMGGHRVEQDPYAAFAAPPGWMLTTAIRGYLRNSGFLRDVVEPGGELPIAAAIEVEVDELCADLEEETASAVLEMQFRVFRPASGTTPEKEILRKVYARKQALSAREASAIAEAWNRELSEIVQEFLADLRPLLSPAP
jgi:hypothetical protein